MIHMNGYLLLFSESVLCSVAVGRRGGSSLLRTTTSTQLRAVQCPGCGSGSGEINLDIAEISVIATTS